MWGRWETGNSSLLKTDVEHVFNVLWPVTIGHAGSVPRVFQLADGFRGIGDCPGIAA